MVHSYVLQDIYDLKDQIQDVEGRYMQGLKELKVSRPIVQPTHALCVQNGWVMAVSQVLLTPVHKALLTVFVFPACA